MGLMKTTRPAAPRALSSIPADYFDQAVERALNGTVSYAELLCLVAIAESHARRGARRLAEVQS